MRGAKFSRGVRGCAGIPAGRQALATMSYREDGLECDDGMRRSGLLMFIGSMRYCLFVELFLFDFGDLTINVAFLNQNAAQKSQVICERIAWLLTIEEESSHEAHNPH
jgi:hypothetical protein